MRGLPFVFSKADWSPKPLKRVFRVVNGSTPKADVPEYWDGEVIWATPDDLGRLNGSPVLGHTSRSITEKGYHSCGTTLVPAASLILSTRAPIGHVAIAGRQMCTNQGCRALVPVRDVDSRYFYYQLLALKPLLAAAGNGSTFKELSTESLEQLRIAQPSQAVQEQIADFLDRETARLDALIAKKRQLQRLLEMRFAAHVSEVFSSLVQRTIPLKRLATRIDVGIAEAATYAYTSVGVPLLRSMNVRPNKLEYDSLLFLDDDFASSRESKRLRKNDLLTVRTGNAGVSAVVPPSLDGAHCFTLLMTTLKDGQEPEFYCRYLNSDLAQDYFRLEGWGTAQVNISVPILQNIPVPFVPQDQQEHAARVLRARECETRLIDDKLRSAIILLAEYRTALITAAVTGQVCETAGVPKLPAEIAT